MSLQRFLDAQQPIYTTALSEVKAGKKESHWMWFIFPQLVGLGKSETAKFYGIRNIQEAREYVSHPLLGKRLIEISHALLSVNERSAYEIFGRPDDLKLQSSMTLFASASISGSVYLKVLDKYFAGQKDPHTISLLGK